MIENAYIHIPFCLRKCNYCSFVSGENIEKKEQYINALINEIKLRYRNEKLKTLYLGGGTPSLLNSEDISKIISCFYFTDLPEITLETNPETVNEEKFKSLQNTGVNRISLGIQTFNDNILKIIGRQHNQEYIYKSINIIKSYFNNISIDIIYGLPFQTMQVLKEDINKALNLNISHISTYGLKIEENSFFYNNPPKNLPDDEQQSKMFLYICKKLEENGFNHYEISNFSKKGYESNHNCAYWQNKNYYGFGLNASGYEKNIRYKNTSNFNDYINNPLIKEEENELTNQEIQEEEIFLALRLKKGIDINKINKKYNINFEEKYKKIISKYENLKLLINKDGYCHLTKKGILLSNTIMSEFIE